MCELYRKDCLGKPIFNTILNITIPLLHFHAKLPSQGILSTTHELSEKASDRRAAYRGGWCSGLAVTPPQQKRAHVIHLPQHTGRGKSLLWPPGALRMAVGRGALNVIVASFIGKDDVLRGNGWKEKDNKG
jgi:hypothetical protein